MNKVLGKSPVGPYTDGYILQSRVGGGTFSLEDNAPLIWERLLLTWGRRGPRPSPRVGVGFFLDEVNSLRLEDLPGKQPQLFESLRAAVAELHRRMDAVASG